MRGDQPYDPLVRQEILKEFGQKRVSSSMSLKMARQPPLKPFVKRLSLPKTLEDVTEFPSYRK